MFDVVRQPYPGVLSRLIDGKLRQRKFGIRERADGYGDHVRCIDQLIVHCRTALRTKVKSDPITTVSCAYVHRARAFDADVVVRESSLHAENTSCTALACQAVTHRYAHWISLGNQTELSATACSASRNHGFVSGKRPVVLDPGALLFSVMIS